MNKWWGQPPIGQSDEATEWADKHTVWVEAGNIRLRVHKEIAVIVKVFLATAFKRGRRFDRRKDDWGWYPRNVGRSNVPSRHAWGLAVDLDAEKNPLAARLHTDMQPWVVSLANVLGLSWGGDWHSVKDPMHFQWDLSPKDAKLYCGLLDGSVTPNPSKRGDTTIHVFVAQQRLGGLKLDGDFGPRTQAAVSRYQSANKLEVTGEVDQATLDHLYPGGSDGGV